MFIFFVFRKILRKISGQVKIIEIILNNGAGQYHAKGRNFIGTPLIIGLKNGKT